MARGRDAHQAHLAAVAALGKNLSRRAGSRCELCAGDADLRVFEVPPSEEPDEDAAILACGGLPRGHRGQEAPRPGAACASLETAMWSEVAPAQIAAVRLLRRVAEHEDWAREALDGLWLDEEMTGARGRHVSDESPGEELGAGEVLGGETLEQPPEPGAEGPRGAVCCSVAPCGYRPSRCCCTSS